MTPSFALPVTCLLLERLLGSRSNAHTLKSRLHRNHKVILALIKVKDSRLAILLVVVDDWFLHQLRVRGYLFEPDGISCFLFPIDGDRRGFARLEAPSLGMARLCQLRLRLGNVIVLGHVVPCTEQIDVNFFAFLSYDDFFTNL